MYRFFVLLILLSFPVACKFNSARQQLVSGFEVLQPMALAAVKSDLVRVAMGDKRQAGLLALTYFKSLEALQQVRLAAHEGRLTPEHVAAFRRHLPRIPLDPLTSQDRTRLQQAFDYGTALLQLCLHEGSPLPGSPQRFDYGHIRAELLRSLGVTDLTKVLP